MDPCKTGPQQVHPVRTSPLLQRPFLEKGKGREMQQQLTHSFGFIYII